MRLKIALVWAMLAAALVAAACNEHAESQEQVPSSTVRLFRTAAVSQAAQTPPGLQATIMWPAEQRLDMYEAGALGDALMDQDPQWGSLIGASQIEVQSGGSITLDNSVEVSLASIDSIELLLAFCEQHYPHSVVLVHEGDAKVTSAKEIIRDYGDPGGG